MRHVGTLHDRDQDLGDSSVGARQRLLDRRHLLESCERQAGLACKEQIQRIDTTLERVADGTYGLCSVCHDPVEHERLEADPLVQICLGCLSAAERRALERDLELAAQVQKTLLPPRDFALPGWELHFRYRPLGAVSGDHFDVLRPQGSDGPALFLFGDVAGKGIAASLLMSHLQAAFRSLGPLMLPTRELLGRINRLFAASTLPNAYATLIFGRLDPDGALEVANAGHPAPLLVTQQGNEPLVATGPPVGLFADSVYSTRRLELERDDFLFLFTDGVSEAVDPAGEEYGRSRLCEEVCRLRGLAAATVVDRALDRLDSFRGGADPTDDTTVLTIRRTAAAGARRRASRPRARTSAEGPIAAQAQ